jgi:hypothetical protein
MDLNYFIKNELLTPANAINIARFACNSQAGFDQFDDLHEDDQQYYVDRAKYAIQFLQYQLVAFNED